MEDKVTIERETLKKLLKNFYSMCSAAGELNIYEWEEMDQDMQKMKEWASEKFDRNIERDSY